MTCMEAQKLITPFINGQLDLDRLEDFINHINECPVCMEELDVYYALLTSMKQLDEDQDLSDNYSEDLKHRIRYYEDLIRRNKAKRIRKRFYLLFMIVSFILFSSISFGKIGMEEQMAERPSFLLHIKGIPDEKSEVAGLFREYDSRLKAYSKQIQQNRRILYIESDDIKIKKNKIIKNKIIKDEIIDNSVKVIR